MKGYPADPVERLRDFKAGCEWLYFLILECRIILNEERS